MTTERLTAKQIVIDRFGVVNFNDLPYYPTFYLEIIDLMGIFARQEVEAVKKQRDELLTALKEISQCKGAYSMDRLEHATNVIMEAKEIAETAIKNAEK